MFPGLSVMSKRTGLLDDATPARRRFAGSASHCGAIADDRGELDRRGFMRTDGSRYSAE
jgi:hypothetical protein